MYQWVFESTFKRGQIDAVEGMVCTNSLFWFQPPCSCISTLKEGLSFFSTTYLCILLNARKLCKKELTFVASATTSMVYA